MTIKHVVLGTGAIGRAVTEELIQRGESVRMVNRSGTMDEVPAGVELVASDLYDPANVREVTQGAKVVYQSSQPPYIMAGKIPSAAELYPGRPVRKSCKIGTR